MNYTFFAVGCYIAMRAVQVLCEGKARARWFRVLITVVSILTLYAALASLVVWYRQIPFLGFDPGQ